MASDRSKHSSLRNTSPSGRTALLRRGAEAAAKLGTPGVAEWLAQEAEPGDATPARATPPAPGRPPRTPLPTFQVPCPVCGAKWKKQSGTLLRLRCQCPQEWIRMADGNWRRVE